MTYAWITGRLTNDVDGDDTEHASGGGYDQGLAGQTVKLMDAYGNIVQTTTTDADGAYQFDVYAGNYCVVFPTINGYEYASKNVGVGHSNSDANSNGITDEFYVGTGQTISDVDASVQSAGGASGQVCIEAEDMWESGFHIGHGANASGGEFLKLDGAGGNGDAGATFNGASGTYDLTIRAQDENDGQSVIMVKVNGHVVGSVKLDRDSDGGGSDSGGFSDFTLEGLNIQQGDTVSVWVDGDYNEYVRLDKFTFDPVSTGPATGSVSGNVFCDIDCDGIDDAGAGTTSKGANLLHDGDFEAGATHYNSDGYGLWYDAGNNGGDIIQGSHAGHHGNAAHNEIFELDGGSILCQNFDVAQAGTYCLTFDAYKNFNLYNSDNDFEIKINGQSVDVVRVTEDGQVTVQLDLAAGSNRIDFVSGSRDNGQGPGVDNIELRQEISTTSPGEPGKADVTVKLVDAGGNTVMTTTTDANGDYKFDDVATGDYKIMVVAPSGQEFTIQDAGSNDSIDSDVNSNGMSGTFSVTAGNNVDIDAGLKDAAPAPLLGSITGRVTNDVDLDDTENAAGGGFDAGFAGETVKLLR